MLATQVAQIIKRELRLPISSVKYRTDSQVVLYQLQTSHIDHPFFVKSRIHQILLHSTKDEWFYLKSKDNVADDATRGLTPAQFKPDCRWINGPPLPLTYIRTRITSLQSPVADPEYPLVVNVNQMSVLPPSPLPMFPTRGFQIDHRLLHSSHSFETFRCSPFTWPRIK